MYTNIYLLFKDLNIYPSMREKSLGAMHGKLYFNNQPIDHVWSTKNHIYFILNVII